MPTPEAALSAVSPSQAISTASTIAPRTIHTLIDGSLRTAGRGAGRPGRSGRRCSAGSATLSQRDRTPQEARTVSAYVDGLMADVEAKNPGELEFHQAVREVAPSIELPLDRKPVYRDHKMLERMIEPERVLMFRVPWADDRGEIHVNRGFRVGMSSASGRSRR